MKMTRRTFSTLALGSILGGCVVKVNNKNNDALVGRSRTNTGANVRRGPGTSFAVIRTLRAGTSVGIYGSNGNWRRIRVGSDYGWIHASLLGRRRGGGGASPAPAADGKEVAAAPCVGENCEAADGYEVVPE